MNNPYHAKLEFEPLSIGDLTNALREETPFTYLRLCHGFWELLADVEKNTGGPVESADPEAAEVVASARSNSRGAQFTDGFMAEFLEELRSLDPADATLKLAVSLHGWKNGGRIEGTPRHPDRVAALIERLLPAALPLFDGLMLKDGVYDRSLIPFLEGLKTRRLILVGPERSAEFAEFLGAGPFEFLPIHPTEARKHRSETEATLRERLRDSAEEKPVVLLQAGTLASYWPLRLRGEFPEATFIDLGQIMDLCRPENVFCKPWGKAFVGEVRAFYEAFSPALFAELPEVKPYRVPAPAHPAEPIPFIENKPVDREEVESLLAFSSEANHWTNFGPVNARLEARIAEDLELPESVSAVAACSCTEALEVAAQTVAHRLGRIPRWIVPAFAFFSTARGTFAGARPVDSGEDGFLSLPKLSEIPGEDYDGIVIVNLFGLHYQLKRYIDFAERHDKYLIIDNAAGYFPAPQRRITGKILETISFHHTKAHGFGEGGCLLTDAETRETAVKLTNFGVGLGNNDLKLGTNAKLSEVSAAYILQRVNQYQQWRFFYSAQARRIQFIGMNAGLERMIPGAAPYRVAPGQIPFLSKREIRREDLANPRLTLHKYYPPCADADSAPVANDLFRRVVNVPCHPQVAEVPEEILFDLLAGLA